jgi:hypothetical protein
MHTDQPEALRRSIGPADRVAGQQMVSIAVVAV